MGGSNQSLLVIDNLIIINSLCMFLQKKTHLIYQSREIFVVYLRYKVSTGSIHLSNLLRRGEA